jgi:hypothetical protein
MPPITDEDDIDLDNIIPNDDDDQPETDDQIDADAQTDTDEDPPADDVDPEAPEGDDQGDDHDDAIAAQRRGGDGEDPPPRRGRANDRIRSLSEDLRRERESNADNRRRLDELAQRVAAGPQQPRETADQRNQRRALMSSEERMNEDLQGALHTMGTRLNETTFLVQDQADKSSFEAKAAVNPLYKRWAPKVEEQLAKLRSNGTNVAREAVLHYVVGQAAVASYNSKQNGSRRAGGARRVARQTTKPGDTRSDTQAPRRGSQRSLEDRLDGVTL